MSQHSTSNLDSESVLERANAAIQRGDHEGFLVYCTDDVEWNFVGDRILRGKVAVREYMRATYKEPPRFDVKELIATSDAVVAVGEITLPDEHGQPVHYDYCDVWTLREGKLATLRAYVVVTPAGTVK